MTAQFDVPPEERDEWEQHTPEGRRKLEAAWPKVMASNPRAYCRWNSQEDEDLRVSFYRSTPIGDLARIHGRRYGAIASRLQKLGIQPDTTSRATTASKSSEAKPTTATDDQHRQDHGRGASPSSDGRVRPGGHAVCEPPDGTVWSTSRPGWFEHDEAALQRWRDQRPRVLDEHPRAHCPWSDAEDEQLLDAYDNGATIDVLGEFHRRQPSAIRSRLRTAILERLGPRGPDRALVDEGLRQLERHPPDVQQALREALGEQGGDARAWQPWSSREDLILRKLLADRQSQQDVAEQLDRSLSEVLARGALLDAGAVDERATEAGSEWSEQDDADLLRLATAGYSGPTLARWFGRTTSAVAARLVRLHWTGQGDGGDAPEPDTQPRPGSGSPPDSTREKLDASGGGDEGATPFDFGLLPQKHLHCPRPDCGEDLELEVVAEIDEGTAYICNVCAARWIRLLRRVCPRCGTEGIAHTAESWENRNYNPFVDFIEQRDDPKDYHRVSRRVWWCEICHAAFD